MYTPGLKNLLTPTPFTYSLYDNSFGAVTDIVRTDAKMHLRLVGPTDYDVALPTDAQNNDEIFIKFEGTALANIKSITPIDGSILTGIQYRYLMNPLDTLHLKFQSFSDRWTVIENYTIPRKAKQSIEFVLGDISIASAAYLRMGARPVNVAELPAKFYGKSYQFKFKVTIENALNTPTVFARVRLFDVTSGVVVDTAVLDNADAADKALPAEYSATLTVGTASGNLRSDATHVYEVQLQLVGPAGGNDRAFISNARIDVEYV